MAKDIRILPGASSGAYQELFPVRVRTEGDDDIRITLNPFLLSRLDVTEACAKKLFMHILNDELVESAEVNHYLAETLTKMQEERIVHRLSKLGFQDDAT